MELALASTGGHLLAPTFRTAVLAIKEAYVLCIHYLVNENHFNYLFAKGGGVWNWNWTQIMSDVISTVT